MPLHEVNNFVDHDIFQALHRFFGQFQVELDALGLDVAIPLKFERVLQLFIAKLQTV
jgi:hypothetical protein